MNLNRVIVAATVVSILVFGCKAPSSPAPTPVPVNAITTVAGNGTQGFSGDGGPATTAEVDTPLAVAEDSSANLYICDSYNNVVRKVSNGTMATLVGLPGTVGFSGDGGVAGAAVLNSPGGVTGDGAGNLYVADTGNLRIRKVAVGTNVITTVVGDGTSTTLNNPSGLAWDGSGTLYIADTGNHRVLKFSGGVVTTYAGTGVSGFSGDQGLATAGQLSQPSAMAVDSAGNLYIADSGNNRIRLVTKATGIITTYAGNGTLGYTGDGGAATSAELNYPGGIALDSSGNLYIGDSGNNVVRKVAQTSKVISTYAGTGTGGYSGDGGAAAAAELNNPRGLWVDSSGNLMVADSLNYRIRSVSP